MRLLLLLVLLLAPLPALADSISSAVQIIGLAISFVPGFQAVGYAILIGASVYGTVEARKQARRAQAQSRSDYNANLTDRNITTLQAEPSRRIVYGRAITGGDIVAIFTSDKVGTKTDGTTYVKPDAYKHIVIVIAAHECQAINEVYVDGIALGTLDGNGWVTTGEFARTITNYREVQLAPGASSTQPAAVTMVSSAEVPTGPSGNPGDGPVLLPPGSYSLSAGNTVITNTGVNPTVYGFTLNLPNPSVRVQKHLGSPTQTVDAMLNGLVPAEWTASDRLRGLAYVVLSIDLENERFQGGPPNATFDISGRKVYDPRTGLTVYSTNPALCIRDWLTAEWGFNCLSGDIDDTYCIAAANACDAPIELIDFPAAALVTDFRTAGNAEAWSATGATATVANGVLTIASTGVDPILSCGGLFIAGAANQAVRVRFKRNAGSGWDGEVFYGTSGHSFSASFVKGIAQPTYGADGYAEATWDMSALTVGGSDWTSSTITSVRIDLGTTASDSFDIDWIAVGPLTAPAYTCNGVLTTGQAKESILQDLAESMGGFVTYGAQWLIQAGAWTAPVTLPAVGGYVESGYVDPDYVA